MVGYGCTVLGFLKPKRVLGRIEWLLDGQGQDVSAKRTRRLAGHLRWSTYSFGSQKLRIEVVVAVGRRRIGDGARKWLYIAPKNLLAPYKRRA